MLKGRRTRKAIAATMLLIFATNTFAPTAAYALTSGPTAPEATSFEPVDTTDMVNLQTGDFTYNIPLLEVPGPEGGYPLSLSYHAGIQPNEDASWVGLGWTLNPGAINRNVNGYPDDYNAVDYTQRSYWAGGSTNSFSIGVSIGIQGAPQVSFGLSFSQDTYQGFGVGANIGLGFDIGGGLGLGVGVSMGPYGGVSAGVNLGYAMPMDKQGSALSTSVGVNTNFSSVSVNGSATVKIPGEALNGKPAAQEVMGISLSSGASKPSLSVGGAEADVYNSNAGKISSESSSYGIPIPITPGITISLGYKYTRYWSDETVSIGTHGTLFMNGQDPSDFNKAYDSYSLLEYPEKNIVDNPEPSKLQGGTYPEFDNYNVLGQGISGSMRPYLFQGKLAGQSKKDNSNNVLLKYYVGGGSPTINHINPQFRFVNDFSNKYMQNNDDYSSITTLKTTNPPFASPQYGTEGFNAGKQKLAGSRNIEFFTNQQIKNEATARNSGFIEPSNCLGFERKITSTITTISMECCGSGQGCTQRCPVLNTITDYSYASQIGGFSITNESGVTYHYGLPVYSYSEVNFSEKIDGSEQNGGYGNNSLSKAKAYAYTWLLTSITGPDFVDRNSDGKADINDWGYWVNFEYGKWTDKYIWRNPSEGYHRDLDNNFRNFSMGKKEIYYLNAISTRTHTAIFEKDVRKDGTGESDNIFAYNTTDRRYTSIGELDASKTVLRLDKMYLFNNTDAAAVLANSGTIPNNYSGNYGNNVIDKYDIDASGRTLITGKAIRVVDFNYDYSLCKGTSNSFDAGKGKLTLKSLNMKGKGGECKIPPMQFEYDLTGSEAKISTGTLSSTSFSSNDVQLEVGELLVTNDAQKTFCGVVTKKTLVDPGLGTYSYTLANSAYTGSATMKQVGTTKNPSYNKDAYDGWGMYKSDANVTLIGQNENLGRTTSSTSSKSLDAWSLREIKTSLGASIKVSYEPDQYKAVLNNNGSMIIAVDGTDGENIGSLAKIIFSNSDDFNYAFSNMKINDKVDFIAMYRGDYSGGSGMDDFDVEDTKQSFSEVFITSFNASEKSITTNVSYKTLMDDASSGFESRAEFVTANFLIGKGFVRPGGGIRVNKLSILTDNNESSTLYSYKNSSGSESGVSSYEPTVLDVCNFPTSYFDGNEYKLAKKDYKRLLYRDINYLLTISRIMPSPGAMYEYVTVENKIKNNNESQERTVDGKTQHQFEVFNENMIQRKVNSNSQSGTNYAKNLSIRSSVARVGNLKRVIRYDNLGKKLSESISNYLHDDIALHGADAFYSSYETKLNPFNYQGLIKERYSEVKEVKQESSSVYDTKATMSSWEEYPNIATGQTTIDYRNGTKVSSQNLAFDFYSGAVTKSVETDAFGNRFMTEITPAYRKTAYSSMGLKVNNILNKNMLTQQAESYTYKVDANNTKLGLVSASVQTWSNNVDVLKTDYTIFTQNDNVANTIIGNVWRPKLSYSWMPEGVTTDGITAIGLFVNFDWANENNPASQNAGWKKTSEITLYNVYSNALEAADMNSLYAASKMGYNHSKVMISGGPARYAELTYSGAEDDPVSSKFNGDITLGSGVVLDGASTAHTGAKSIKLTNGQTGFYYEIPVSKLGAGRDYYASVWAKSSTVATPTNAGLSYSVNGGAAVYASTMAGAGGNGYQLINLKIPGSAITGAGNLRISCYNNHGSDVYFDDLRFHPLNAGVTSYVYDNKTGEVNYILDNNNIFTKFEYDAAGRLVKTYRETMTNGMRQVSEHSYNYGQPLGYSSAAINNKAYYRSCSGGQQPVAYYVTVPAGQFSSCISPDDANQLAENYAQNQANTYGTCTSSSTITLKNMFIGGAGFPTSIKVEFMQGSSIIGTYNFPATASGSTNVTVPPATYQLRFTLPAGFESYPSLTYQLNPGGMMWQKSNGSLMLVTGNVQINSGTTYTLTATND